MKKIIMLFVILGLSLQLWAVNNVYWTGSPSSTDWTTTSNWTGGQTPYSLLNSIVNFNGTTNLAPNVNNPASVAGISFGTGAATYILRGSTISVGAYGLSTYGPNRQAIRNDLNLTANQQWLTNTANSRFDLNGAINNNGFTVTKNGPGTLVFGGSTSNTGTGLLEVNGGKVILNKSSGATAISGNLEVGAAEVHWCQNEQIANNSAVNISHTSGVLNLGGFRETIGSLSGVGRVILDNGGCSTPGLLNVSGSSATTYAGVISGRGQLIKSGAGTLTLSGINTYTGTTTVSGGTLRLGRNQAISNMSSLILSGGRLATSGYSQNMGTLTLTADSTIDMSGGNSILRFANSRTATWNTSSTLSITGWNGNANGGGVEQFLVGASGLNANQIALIRFFNPAGFAPGIYEARLLASGEIVPVPEPATIGLGALLAGLVAKRMRRRKSAKAEDQAV